MLQALAVAADYEHISIKVYRGVRLHTNLDNMMNGCTVSVMCRAKIWARPPEPAIAIRIMFACLLAIFEEKLSGGLLLFKKFASTLLAQVVAGKADDRFEDPSLQRQRKQMIRDRYAFGPSMIKSFFGFRRTVEASPGL